MLFIWCFFFTLVQNIVTKRPKFVLKNCCCWFLLVSNLLLNSNNWLRSVCQHILSTRKIVWLLLLLFLVKLSLELGCYECFWKSFSIRWMCMQNLQFGKMTILWPMQILLENRFVGPFIQTILSGIFVFGILIAFHSTGYLVLSVMLDDF